MTTPTDVWHSYSYDCLPTKAKNKHYIRVLDLLPAAHRQDRLECIIRIAELDSDAGGESYETLSYVWGRDTASDFVSYGKARITMGKNLSLALRRLRKTDQARTLWIDAICIN